MRALVLCAWLALGCEVSVNVLDPPSDAGPLDAATDAGGCGVTADPCTRDEDCCSGVCGLDPVGKVSCRPATGCSSLGASCDRAGACCALGCFSGACSTVDCAQTGESCQTNTDCCSHHCLAGSCAPTGTTCAAAGDSCVDGPDCCSKSCLDEGGKFRCGLLQGCRVQGETCTLSQDCCSGSCMDAGSGVLTCAALAQCTSADGKPCKRQVGEICKDDAECCSRSCVGTKQGPKRCAASGGCLAHCEICTAGSQCCSGTCVTGADGAERCGPPAGCLPPGEICENDDQCCAETTKGKCFEDPPVVGAKRCHETPEPPCGQDGDSCALASGCCGGYCVGQEALACSSTCAPDGEACTLRADCCGQFSDCLVIAGARRCAPIVQ